MENKKSIELITLEVLGSLDAADRNNLQLLKETDENFPWKIQAEFQNLSALLPSILKITEQPSAVAKERMINKLSQIVTPIAANNQTNKYIFNSGEKHSDNDHLEEILNKNKIDWGSLAVSKQMPQHKSVTGYEEVKPKVPVSREDSVKIEITKAAQENEKLPEVSEVEFDDEIEKRDTSSLRLKKYVIVSIILFVVSLSLFGYLFIFNQSDTQKTLTEKKVDENIISAPVEEFFYNNVQEPESSVSASDVQTIENENKVETKAETKTEPELNNKNKNLLPKAPPKVPDSIDEKQIVTTQISSTLDVKEKEEIFDFVLHGLYSGFNNIKELPLKGKTIVITRTIEQSEESASALTSLGANVVIIPTLDIVPPSDWSKFDSVVSHSEKIDFIIFTSVHAVQMFLKRCKEIGALINYNRTKVVAVGSKTSAYCHKNNINVNIVPDKFSAEGVIEALSKYNMKNKVVFIPRSAIGREELPMGLKELGAIIKSVPVYNVAIPSGENVRTNLQQLDSTKVDLFIFTSPSTFENFLQIADVKNPFQYFGKFDIAAIGPTTKEAIESKKVKVKILPDEFTINGLTKKIVEYYNNQKEKI